MHTAKSTFFKTPQKHCGIPPGSPWAVAQTSAQGPCGKRSGHFTFVSSFVACVFQTNTLKLHDQVNQSVGSFMISGFGFLEIFALGSKRQ